MLGTATYVNAISSIRRNQLEQYLLILATARFLAIRLHSIKVKHESVAPMKIGDWTGSPQSLDPGGNSGGGVESAGA